MTHRKPGAFTIALAAALLVLTSTPVLALDCVETQLMLTGDYGDRYVLSCTEPAPAVTSESKARDPNIAKLDEPSTHGEQIVEPHAHDEPKATTQAAQAR